MKIVVTTPTGHVGRHLVSHLTWAGVRPTVLVRDAARLADHVRAAVDVVELDQTDADAVVEATRGADRLFWVDPPLGGEDPVADHDRLGRVAARAVTENGIAHTVLLSSVGAEKRLGAGDIDGLALTEQRLDAAVRDGVGVTHLRCGFFFSNLLMELPRIREGVVRVALPVDLPMAWVAPRDIALVAALRLLAPARPGRQVQAVHGPRDLSWRQAAEVVARASGRPLVVEQVSDAQVLAGLRKAGLGEVAAQAVLGMSSGLREGFTPEQARDASTTTPTTLETWAREELVPALAAPA